MAVTPYLELFLPDGDTLVADFVAGTADAMTKLDDWAQAHASSGVSVTDATSQVQVIMKTRAPAASGVQIQGNGSPMHIEGATVYSGANYATQVGAVTDADIAAATSGALTVGDYTFIRQGADFDTVAFATSGLYIVTGQLTMLEGNVVGELALFINNNQFAGGAVYERVTAPDVPMVQYPVLVRPDNVQDAAQSNIGYPVQILPVAWQSSGGPLTPYATLTIYKAF